MSDEGRLTVEERLFQLFQHLSIEQAHVAANLPEDWKGLATAHPEVIVSLTLACPPRMDSSTLKGFSTPLFVFTGDREPSDEIMKQAVSEHPDATLLTLSDYSKDVWADTVADRTGEVGSALMAFLERIEQQRRIEAVDLPEGEGEIAGLTYRIQGSGIPLVLLPLALAPSQWEPLLPELSKQYCTILVQGSVLGYAAILETRGHSTGYLEVVENLVNEIHLQPGEKILELGCGTGAITRWIAHQTEKANRLTGVDINAYLIREAKNLANKESLEERAEFQKENAEALSFPDNSFDVTLSFTVLEEVDADRMLSEMVRVTRPGGRVGVLVRSVDMHVSINLPLRPELKAKVEAPPIWWGGVGEKGCADVSLYRRFHQVGLSEVKMMPQWATYVDRKRLETLYPLFVPLLDPEEVDEWWEAVAQSQAEGTSFIAQPFHSAVGKVVQ